MCIVRVCIMCVCVYCVCIVRVCIVRVTENDLHCACVSAEELETEIDFLKGVIYGEAAKLNGATDVTLNLCESFDVAFNGRKITPYLHTLLEHTLPQIKVLRSGGLSCFACHNVESANNVLRRSCGVSGSWNDPPRFLKRLMGAFYINVCKALKITV